MVALLGRRRRRLHPVEEVVRFPFHRAFDRGPVPAHLVREAPLVQHDERPERDGPDEEEVLG